LLQSFNIRFCRCSRATTGATQVEFGAPLRVTGHELIDAVRATRFRAETIDLGYLFGGPLASGGGNVRHPHKSPARHSQSGGEHAFSISLRLKDDLGDCYRCRTWDGTTEGATDVFVAKDPKLRTSVAAGSGYNQAGSALITFAYAYTSTKDANNITYWTRAVTGSDASTESDVVTPDLNFNDTIIAEAIPLVVLNGKNCTLQAQTVGHAWAATGS
jgi:hypothetical protein